MTSLMNFPSLSMEFTTSEDGSNVHIEVHYIMYELEVANRKYSHPLQPLRHPPHRLYKTIPYYSHNNIHSYGRDGMTVTGTCRR
jgi:hypothetical protein